MAIDDRNQRLLRYAMLGIPLGLLLWFSPTIRDASGLRLPVLFGDDFSNPWLREVRRWPFYLDWLLPALLVAGLEARASRAPVRAAFAAALFCLAATVSYHIGWTATLLLGFGGPQLLVRPGAGWATWWQDVQELRVSSIVLDHAVAWSVGATVGGLIVGYLTGVILLLLTSARTVRSA